MNVIIITIGQVGFLVVKVKRLYFASFSLIFHSLNHSFTELINCILFDVVFGFSFVDRTTSSAKVWMHMFRQVGKTHVKIRNRSGPRMLPSG